jgi:NADPH:quinone reductase-like Zn-dependent oxidoreductase
VKASVFTQYGKPEVIQIQEVEKPSPRDGEMLIRLEATVAAAPDCAFRKGEPFISRFFTGLTKPKHIPGDVLAGVIEAIGKDVKGYKTGDRVYGSSGTNFGTNAEYITLPEESALALMPENLSSGEAAALSEGGLTALPFLRDQGKIQAGDKVLINGAAGGIGVYAVQIAKYFGAEVTGVCGTTNLELVEALGAGRVIDYTKTDFAETGERYDIIFDTVGKSSFTHCKKALMPNGIYLSTFPAFALMINMALTSVFGKQKAVFTATGLRTPGEKRKDLLFLKMLAETGNIKPVISRTFLLSEMTQAHRYVETGHKKGSAVILINSD